MKKIIFLLIAFLGLNVSAFASADPYSFSKTKAFCLFQKGDYERAIYLYEKIITSGKVDANVFYNLGCLYVKTEDYYRAIKSFEQVLLAMSPLSKDASYNLSVIYGKYLNDSQKAKYFYSRYKRLQKSMELSYVDN